MAANAELNLVIGVVDKASGPLAKLTGGLGTLAKIGGAAFLGGAVAGVGALSAALVGGIGDARDHNLVMAQTEAVIKSTGGAAGQSADEIAQLAGELSAASGKSLFGDDDIQKGQNMLLTFTNIKETMPDATKIMLDMAQALGTDAGGAAVQLGKALNDPINGVSALTRVGVTFTDQQKEQIKTLQESGDMAGAQAVILAELQKEFGGSAEAAARADGGMAQFKDRMGELAESVGAKVLPALNSFMGWLNSPNVQTGITSIVDGLVNGLGAAFTWLTGTALPAVQAVFTAVWPTIKEAIATVVDWLTSTAWPFLQTVFVWITDTGLPALQAAFDTVWPVIQTAVKAVVDWLKDVAWPFLQEAFAWVKDTGLPAVQSAFETIWPVIMAAVETVYVFFKDVVWPWLKQAFDLLKDTVLPSLKAAFDEVWPKIKAAVQAVFDWLKGTFFPWLQNTAFPWLADVALPALKVAFEVAWAAISTAVRVVYTFLRDTVWPWLRDTAFPWIADVALPAVQKAFETVWPLIKTAVENAYIFFRDTVWPWLKTAMGNIGDWITTAKDTWSTAWGAISGAVTLAKDTISGVIQTIKDLVQGAIDQINDLIRLINNIPGVNIPRLPNLPSGDGGGGSSFNSIGGRQPLLTGSAGLSTRSVATTQNNSINITINATDRRSAELGVRDALVAGGLL